MKRYAAKWAEVTAAKVGQEAIVENLRDKHLKLCRAADLQRADEALAATTAKANAKAQADSAEIGSITSDSFRRDWVVNLERCEKFGHLYSDARSKLCRRCGHIS